MSTTTHNPWTLPFERLLAERDLSSRMTVKLTAVEGLHRLPPESACGVLRDHLKKLFIADQQEVAWVRKALGICHAHAISFYPNVKSYAQRLHEPRLELSTDPLTRMTTSEAGWGKTELGKSLVRLFASPAPFEIGHSLPPQRIVGVIRLRIEGKTSRAALLNALAAAAGFPEDYKSSGIEETEQIRRQLYIAGVMLILVDEFQFIAQSSASNLIAKTLHFLREIGIPVLFIGNFSLGHKLLKRPQEDQHRFLGQPEVLLPETYNSTPFLRFLQGLVEAMGDLLVIKPDADAKLLHWYTGGNRRTICELVVLAYLQVRSTAAARGSAKVTLNDLTAAYTSFAFATRRMEVEFCRKYLIEGVKPRKRLDLWCPFPLSTELEEHRAELARSIRQTEVSNAALQASATPDEIRGMKAMQEVFDTPDPGARVNVPSRPPRRKVTMEDMLASKPPGYQ